MLTARQVLLGCEEEAAASRAEPDGALWEQSVTEHREVSCTQQQQPKELVGISLPAHQKWDKENPSRGSQCIQQIALPTDLNSLRGNL